MNKKFFCSILFFTFLITTFPFTGTADNGGGKTVDVKRNKLIGYMISGQLPSLHFSDKVVDDQLAEDAFKLYIKQLDFQKRFLLKSDVDELRSFALYIDDNLRRGTITLPETGYAILNERISQVDKMVDDLLAEKIDPKTKGELETDYDNLDYAKSLEELKKRWRKILQVQLNNQYLDLEEDQAEKDERKSEGELWGEVYEKIAKRNHNFFHRLHQETLQDHYDRYFNSVTRAFDPHTNYIAPAGKEQFDINMRGSLEGIGALLSEEDGRIKIVRIIPGSASARQGRLHAEDIILEVAQGEEVSVDVTDMRVRDAVRLIRGPKGTEVRLTVRKSDGAKEVIAIIRDVVQIEETFVKHTVIDGPEGEKYGYIHIPSFYRDFEKNSAKGGRNSSTDTAKAITELREEENLSGMILDLRNNGGGALFDAVEIAGMFIDYGPVVQVKTSNGNVRVLKDESYGVYWDGPLIVLVNKFSASASEIVAAAIQDYGRGVVMGGAYTHGKGTVQTIIDLNENIPLLHLRRYEDLGALKVMIQKFYRVTGGSTQYKGVEPDIVLPSLLAHVESGERYLEHSLPWDSIESVDYTRSPGTLDLNTLRSKSEKRVKEDEAFLTIVEEAEKARERSEETIISLNIDDMRVKREETEKARENLSNYLSGYQEQDDDTGDDSDKSAEERKSEWLKELVEDPYIQEAGRVIRDMSN